VWSDRRSGTSNLYAIRTSPKGEPKSVLSFRISSDPSTGLLAAVTDGSDYLLFVTQGFYATHQTLLRIDSADRVQELGTAGLNGTSPSAYLYSAIWTGHEYVVAYPSANSGVSCEILDSAGRVIKNDIVLLNAPGQAYPQAKLLWSEGRVLFVWRPAGAAIQSASATVQQLLAPGFVPFQSVAEPQTNTVIFSAATNGRRALITWVQRTESDYENGLLRGRIVDSSGVASTGPFTIATGIDRTITQGTYPPAVAWNGSSFLVSMVARNVAGYWIDGLRVSSDGVVLDTDPQPLASAARNELLLRSESTPDGVFLFWLDQGGLTPSLRGDVVNSSLARTHGSPLDPGVLLSRGLAGHAETVGVRREDSYLLAWTELTDEQRVLLGRYDLNGKPLDDEPVQVRPSNRPQSQPHLATDGRNALVVWVERSSLPPANQLFVELIDGALRSGDAPPGVTAQVVAEVAVHCNGHQYLVAWQEPTTRRLMLARWSLSGQPIDVVPVALAPPRFDSNAVPLGFQGPPVGDAMPAIAWNGNEYLIVYGHEMTFLPGTIAGPTPTVYLHQIRGKRLSENLVEDGPELELGPVETNVSDALAPAAITAGRGFATTWLQRGSPYGEPIVVNRYVDGTALSTLRGKQRTHVVPSSLLRLGGITYLAYDRSLFTLGEDASFVSERELPATVVSAIDDRTRLVYIDTALDPVSNVPRSTVRLSSPLRIRSSRH
jgi:hypothetical protein